LYQLHAGSAKAGIDNITKTLAVELGPKNIRVNGIAPGAIEDTAGMDKLTPPKAKPDIATSPFDYFPIDRFGKKSDISELALFLVSDAASYITGTTILVDGGATLTAPNFTLISDDIRKLWKSKL